MLIGVYVANKRAPNDGADLMVAETTGLRTALVEYLEVIDLSANITATLISSISHYVDILPYERYLSPDEFMPIKLVDINFDGYDDIKILTGEHLGSNKKFDYFLYNKNNNDFEVTDAGSELSGSSVEFDPKNKSVRVFGSDGYHSYYQDQYHWNDRALDLRSSKNIRFDVKLRTTNLSLFKSLDPIDTVCGEETEYLNNKRELVSIQLELKDHCYDTPNEKNKAGQLYSLLTQKPKGYSIRGNAENFSIIFDKPKKPVIEQTERAWLASRNARMPDPLSNEFITCDPFVINENTVDPLILGRATVNLTCYAPNHPDHLSFMLVGKISFAVETYKPVDRVGVLPIQFTQLTIANDGKELQTLPVYGKPGGVPLDLLPLTLELVDVNADGHDDIKLWNVQSAGMDEGFSFYLFDPQTQRYKASDRNKQP